MKQEGEEKHCKVARDIFAHCIEQNYSYIKEKLPLLEILDPDAIHDIRVTSRRNRALFTEFKPYLPKSIRKQYLRENRQITKLLGKRRELDVLCHLLMTLKENYSNVFNETVTDFLMTYLNQEREKEKENCLLAKNILENRIKNLYIDLSLDYDKSLCIFKYGRKRIDSALDDLYQEYKRIKKIDDPFDENIHQFRILIKKTRYMFEIYEKIFGDPLSEWLAELKSIQNHLGTWNDYRILLLTFQKIYKNEKQINLNEFSNIKGHICDILFSELNKIKEKKLKKGEFLSLKKDIKHKCIEHKCNKI